MASNRTATEVLRDHQKDQKEKQFCELINSSKNAYDILKFAAPHLCVVWAKDKLLTNRILVGVRRLGLALNAMGKLGEHVVHYDYAPPEVEE